MCSLATHWHRPLDWPRTTRPQIKKNRYFLCHVCVSMYVCVYVYSDQEEEVFSVWCVCLSLYVCVHTQICVMCECLCILRSRRRGFFCVMCVCLCMCVSMSMYAQIKKTSVCASLCMCVYTKNLCVYVLRNTPHFCVMCARLCMCVYTKNLCVHMY